MIKKRIQITLTTLVMFSTVGCNDSNNSDINSTTSTTETNNTINVYGPGGPYPAINEAAKEFSKTHDVKINVIKGPLSKWSDNAQKDADIIYSGAEFMMTNFVNKITSIDKSTITPLYLRKSGLLVRPGNPKDINSLMDLTEPNINILVVNGAGLTGVWESMISKTQDISALKKLRKNIVFYAKNSGLAKQQWIKDKNIDVWLTWNIWQKSNAKLADFVSVDEKYVVYRDCGIALTKEGKDRNMTKQFFDYLKSTKAKPIFQKWGWQ